MEIGPINHDRLAVDKPDNAEKKDGRTDKSSPSEDELIISAEARDRLEKERSEKELGIDEDRPVVDSVEYTPEKLRLIRERIDSGFYEQAKILDRTVEKLIDEMLENIKLFYK